MENSFASGILKKLRVEKTSKILIIDPPEGYLQLFSSLEFDTEFKKENEGNYEFVQVFGSGRAELEKQMMKVKEAGKYDCLFWACYPKGGGLIKSDLKRELVWECLELIGLRPVSQIALDETWSALRGRPHAEVGK
jgi:hypothetical protein